MPTRTGSGEALVAVNPAAAFAYLADPRNAGEWFASVALEEAPQGRLREGMTWRFVQRLRRGHVIPVRLQTYEYPSRFVWRTRYPWPRTNLAWELHCEPAEAANEATSAPRTHLRFSITIEPRPLGWPALALGAWLSPHSLRHRAQGAVDRARELLLAREEALGGQAERPGREPRQPKRSRKSQRPGKSERSSR